MTKIAQLWDLIETSSFREDIKGIKDIKENDDDYNDKEDNNKNETYDKDNKDNNEGNKKFFWRAVSLRSFFIKWM